MTNGARACAAVAVLRTEPRGKSRRISRHAATLTSLRATHAPHRETRAEAKSFATQSHGRALPKFAPRGSGARRARPRGFGSGNSGVPRPAVERRAGSAPHAVHFGLGCRSQRAVAEWGRAR